MEKLCQCCHEKDGSEMTGAVRLKYLCEILHEDVLRTKELVTAIDFDTNELVVGYYNDPSIPSEYDGSSEDIAKYIEKFNKDFPSKEWRMKIKYCPFCGRKIGAD